MSIEALSKFSNAVAIDPSLKAKIERSAKISLEKLTSMNLAEIEAASIDYLSATIEVAGEYGYHFTKDELKAQIVRYSSGDRELDDDSLDEAVGGTLQSQFDTHSQRKKSPRQFRHGLGHLPHNLNGWLRF